MKTKKIIAIALILALSSAIAGCNENVSIKEAAQFYCNAVNNVANSESCSFDVSIQSNLKLGEKAELESKLQQIALENVSVKASGYFESPSPLLCIKGSIKPLLTSIPFCAIAEGEKSYITMPQLSADTSYETTIPQTILGAAGILFNSSIPIAFGNPSAKKIKFSKNGSVKDAYRIIYTANDSEIKQFAQQWIMQPMLEDLQISKNPNYIYAVENITVSSFEYSAVISEDELLQVSINVKFNCKGEFENFIKSGTICAYIDLFDYNVKKDIKRSEYVYSNTVDISNLVNKFIK